MNIAHASTKTVSVDIVSTVSSASCENAETSIQWSCNIYVVKGSVVAVLLGCVSVTADCLDEKPMVGDSEADTYAIISGVGAGCSSAGCYETAWWTTPTITGVDAITFTVAKAEFFGADIFDLTGVNASAGVNSYGDGSLGDGVPGAGVFSGFKEFTGGITLTGIAAFDVQKISAGPGDNMIPDQPCPQGCNSSLGDWQAAEYSDPSSNSSLLPTFNYPSTNGGWQDLAISFAPAEASTAVTCATPFVAASSSKCTATVTGNNSTGIVAWSANSTGTFSPPTCTLSSGHCSVLFTPSSSATANVTGSYGGDPSNPSTAGSALLKVAKATPQVNVNCVPSPVPTGSESTCTVTVTGASPAGTITWASSGIAAFSPESTCTLSTGSCAVAYTPTSTTSPISITALYSGDRNNDNGSGVFSLAVGAAGSSTSSSTTSSTPSATSTTSTTSPASSVSSVTTVVSTTTVSMAASSTTSLPASTSGSISSTSAQSQTSGSSSSIGGSYGVLLAADVILLTTAGLFLKGRDRARSSAGL
ncbi:MAG: hypothetical protein OK456_01330 [Thaumarchaeota archaeon]|nr:hypothetical protein [Nitrososphaerota archaeon]